VGCAVVGLKVGILEVGLSVVEWAEAVAVVGLKVGFVMVVF